MSTIRISCSSAGIRLDWVRMMSGSASASSRGSTRTSIAPVGGDLGVDQLLQPRLEVGRHLGQVEVHPGLARLHVAAGDQRAEVAEHHAAQHVQAGVGAHEQRAAVVLDRARAPAVPTGGTGSPGGRDQVEVVALAGADDAGLHALPEQHAVVRRLAAAARVEGRPVQHDARPPDRPVAATVQSHSRRVGSARSSRWVRP